MYDNSNSSGSMHDMYGKAKDGDAEALEIIILGAPKGAMGDMSPQDYAGKMHGEGMGKDEKYKGDYDHGAEYAEAMADAAPPMDDLKKSILEALMPVGLDEDTGYRTCLAVYNAISHGQITAPAAADDDKKK